MAVIERMTQTQAAELIAMLAAASPVPEWPLETQRLYTRRIIDIEHAVMVRVVARWIDTHGSGIADRPGIGDLRKAAVIAQREARGVFVEPDVAWSLVQMHLRHERFPDQYPLVKLAVERMGLRELKRSDNTVADRAHFLRFYNDLYQRSLDECAANDGARPLSSHFRAVVQHEATARLAGGVVTAPLPPGDRRMPLLALVSRVLNGKGKL